MGSTEQATVEVLSGDNYEAIAKEAYAEMDQENGIEKKKIDDVAEDISQENAEESSQPVEQKEEEAAQPQDEKEEVQPEKKDEEAPEVKSEEAGEDEIQQYAVKHSMTYAEAKADIEATKSVLKNYKTPDEIARALRSTQSAYDKLKAQVDQKQKDPVFVRLSDDDFIMQAREHLSKEAEKHVESFRKRFPAKSELMTDEAIIEELAVNALPNYKQYAERKEGELKTTAAQKREKALASLSEVDKKFIPDVKAVLDKTADSQILREEFDVVDIVHWAKGQRYDADMKASYERGLKAGKENPQVVGLKTTGGGNTTTKKVESSNLNEAQRKRAEEMFPSIDGFSAEDAYKNFREVFADDLKKNPRFIG